MQNRHALSASQGFLLTLVFSSTLFSAAVSTPSAFDILCRTMLSHSVFDLENFKRALQDACEAGFDSSSPYLYSRVDDVSVVYHGVRHPTHAYVITKELLSLSEGHDIEKLLTTQYTSRKFTCLHEAAHHPTQAFELLTLFLEQFAGNIAVGQAAIMMRTFYGATVLHEAVEYETPNHELVVSLLLRQFADNKAAMYDFMMMRNQWGQTALDCAKTLKAALEKKLMTGGGRSAYISERTDEPFSDWRSRHLTYLKSITAAIKVLEDAGAS